MASMDLTAETFSTFGFGEKRRSRRGKVSASVGTVTLIVLCVQVVLEVCRFVAGAPAQPVVRATNDAVVEAAPAELIDVAPHAAVPVAAPTELLPTRAVVARPRRTREKASRADELPTTREL